MESDIILNNFYAAYNSEDWELAEKFILKIYSKQPNSFWVLTTVSSVKYELKKYEEALLFVEKAFKLNSDSPLVLWDYAGVLYALDKEEEAIKYWEKIISLSPEEIGKKRTTEGIRWAKSLINDSIFRIGQAYYYLDNDEKSREYINKHLSRRKKGLPSLYSKKFVLSFLE